jgi:hypothetical protein
MGSETITTVPSSGRPALSRAGIFSRAGTVLFIACLVGAPSPVAGQVTWIGDTSTAWTTGANWEGGVAPTETDQAVFGSLLSGNQPSLTSGTVASLTFLSPQGGWTVTTSGSLRLNNATGIDDSLNTSGTTTINGRLFLAASGTKALSVGVGGTLRVTGVLDFSAGTRALNVLGGVVSANGVNGGGSSGSQKDGTGTLVITASSTLVDNFILVHPGFPWVIRAVQRPVTPGGRNCVRRRSLPASSRAV